MNKTHATLVAYWATLKWNLAMANRTGRRATADVVATHVAAIAQACTVIGIPAWLLGRVSKAIQAVEDASFVVLPDADSTHSPPMKFL